MLASQRHNEIQALLRQNGAVTIAGLMDTFGISMETARRDLAAMEKSGLLTRVHGGALPPDTTQIYRPLKDRMDQQHTQKLAIAKAAVALVEEGDTIAIDIPNCKIELKVSDEALAERRAKWVCPEPKVKTGYLARYAKLVSSADKGAILQ